MTFNIIFRKLGALTLVMAGLVLILYSIPAVPAELISYSWYNLIFYAVLSVLVTYIIYLGIKNKSNQTFMLSLMVTFFLKIIACIGFFVIFYLVTGAEPKLFFIPFGAFYLAYTIFETIHLYKLNQLLNDKTEQK